MVRTPCVSNGRGGGFNLVRELRFCMLWPNEKERKKCLSPLELFWQDGYIWCSVFLAKRWENAMFPKNLNLWQDDKINK